MIMTLLLVRQEQFTSHLGWLAMMLTVFWPLDPMFQVVAGFCSLWSLSINRCCVYSHNAILSHLSPCTFSRLFFSLQYEMKHRIVFRVTQTSLSPHSGRHVSLSPFPTACRPCRLWALVPALGTEGAVWLSCQVWNLISFSSVFL